LAVLVNVDKESIPPDKNDAMALFKLISAGFIDFESQGMALQNTSTNNSYCIKSPFSKPDAATSILILFP
jgi:hypothetical protein